MGPGMSRGLLGNLTGGPYCRIFSPRAKNRGHGARTRIVVAGPSRYPGPGPPRGGGGNRGGYWHGGNRRGPRRGRRHYFCPPAEPAHPPRGGGTPMDSVEGVPGLWRGFTVAWGNVGGTGIYRKKQKKKKHPWGAAKQTPGPGARRASSRGRGGPWPAADTLGHRAWAPGPVETTPCRGRAGSPWAHRFPPIEGHRKVERGGGGGGPFPGAGGGGPFGVGAAGFVAGWRLGISSGGHPPVFCAKHASAQGPPKPGPGPWEGGRERGQNPRVCPLIPAFGGPRTPTGCWVGVVVTNGKVGRPARARGPAFGARAEGAEGARF